MPLPATEVIQRRMKRFYGNVVQGPMGFAMPEAIARIIEQAAKSLPKDFTYRHMAKAPADFELPAGERTDVSFITTDAVDREGEVVLPGGGDWSQYNKVVTFAHKYDQLPAGSNWWIRPKMKGSLGGLVAKTHYPDKPADWGDAPWMPSAVFHMMQQPVPSCTGKSIGFIPMNIREATNEEKSKRPELKNVPIIDKWMGLEYAVAPVPCNGPSEMVAVSRALKSINPDLAKIFSASFALKDMEDGDGLAMHTLQCPQGHGVAQLVMHDSGKVYCKKCMKEYDGTDMQNGNNPPPADDKDDPDPEDDEADQKRLADALAAPYYTEESYRQRIAEQNRELLATIKSETQSRIIDAFLLASGRV